MVQASLRTEDSSTHNRPGFPSKHFALVPLRRLVPSASLNKSADRVFEHAVKLDNSSQVRLSVIAG